MREPADRDLIVDVADVHLELVDVSMEVAVLDTRLCRGGYGSMNTRPTASETGITASGLRPPK